MNKVSISEYMSNISVDDLIDYEKEIIHLHEHGVLPDDSELRELKNKLREATNCPITMMNMEYIVEHEIAQRWLYDMNMVHTETIGMF